MNSNVGELRLSPERGTDLFAAVCAKHDLRPVSELRHSESTSGYAKTVDDTVVFVRLSVPQHDMMNLAAKYLRSSNIRTPELLVTEQFAGCVLHIWEYADVRTGSQLTLDEMGVAIARLETVPAPPVPVNNHIPLKRCVVPPGAIPGVSDDEIRALQADTLARWNAWQVECADVVGWIHGDFNRSNMGVYPNGNMVLWDLGEVGYGPLGFDLAMLWTQVRFEHTDLRAVERAAETYKSAGGRLCPERVRDVLEPVSAAVSALRAAEAVNRNPLCARAGKRRLRSLIDGTDDPWYPIPGVSKELVVLK